MRNSVDGIRGGAWARTLRAAPLLLALGGPALAADTVQGRPTVIDGDTLQVGGTLIGLYGVAAPAAAQICQDAEGANIRCGERARRALARHIGTGEIVCESRGVDRSHRPVALCRLGREDLAAWMVRQGHAVADKHVAEAYNADETRAWAARRGLWAGVFEDPTTRSREAGRSPAHRTASAQ
ncbi:MULTISPECIES: thermonuclease family protein [Methylobacterium]|uniref:TNase-like domain-containing protein n=2 Tax=Pseudomonadota TaxID=1224 RepID=A0ABQ4T2P4_9HYPH|nr:MULTISPECIES: thermonuclease family protein [Methylobacterium]GBU19645.1 hypothetical protein AwMethylo_38600 [Methylobacterium sp.]GJE08538.1 hypothetical protein AOPFMNJM_3878 [Methylobacterium jeotgali]